MTNNFRYDFIIVGGGAAGCVLANRLSAIGTVCLIEAGPDYGSLAMGRWPKEMLEARDLPHTHAWEKEANFLPPSRSRLIGGSSAENNCYATWGSPSDYDLWETRATGWNWHSISPHIQSAHEMMRVRSWDADEKCAFASSFAHGLVDAKYCEWGSFNDATIPHVVDFPPVNRIGNLRFNAALAYLDPARGRSTLKIIDNAIVDKVIMGSGKAEGVEYIRDKQRIKIFGNKIVLASGAYGSPLVLLRSGIGSKEKLEPHGITLTHELNAVGRGLLDHPSAGLTVIPTKELTEQTLLMYKAGTLSTCQVIGRTGTSGSDPSQWNTHLIPMVIPVKGDRFIFKVICDIMDTKSEGDVNISGVDPEMPPVVLNGFLSDPDGADRLCLEESLMIARDVLTSNSMSDFVAGLGPLNLNDLKIEKVHSGYHMSSTCRMGNDKNSVVDSSGQVYGVENLYVADASIMPFLPKANTHMTTLAIAERLASLLH